MQTVSSQFRVSVNTEINVDMYLNIHLNSYFLNMFFIIYLYIFHVLFCDVSLGELGQTDDQLEEHPSSLCALSDSQ